MTESLTAGRVVLVLGRGRDRQDRAGHRAHRGARRPPRAVGRLRPADHAAPARPAARRRPRGRRPRSAALERPRSREDVLTAALDELAAGAVLVIEDLHWADDATLDLVALLGRRLVRSPGCLILTSRSEALPEVRRVLAALPRECVRRIEPRRCRRTPSRISPSGRARRVRPARRHRRQPVLRHRGAGRAHGRGPRQRARRGRAARQRARRRRARGRRAGRGRPGRDRAVAGRRAAPPRSTSASTPGCCTCAARRSRSATTSPAARSRRASRPIRRRELDRDRAARARDSGADAGPRAARAPRPPRGRRRRDPPPRARRRARPRARPAGTGRRSSTGRPRCRRAGGSDPEALEGVAIEAYLCGRPEQARRGAPRAARAPRGRRRRARDGRRPALALALLWWAGQGQEATAAGDRAIAVLEAFPDSRELAMALSARSQLAMLSEHAQAAIELGMRAVTLGRSSATTRPSPTR